MINLESDYTTGMHPAILARLAETNLIPATGYGADPWSAGARAKIAEACGCPDAQVELLVGGTQTNAVIIASMLRDWEGVIAAETGHVSVHESGAIEYTGHKVITVPQKDGKVTAAALNHWLADFEAQNNAEHMVIPGMVYISHPTEYGTLYTLAELTELSEACHAAGLPLYLDGARLGYGLMSRHTDVSLQDIARLTDVFYIGGTKVGAICGEAVVFTKKNRPVHFMNSVKKRGALLAKGRLLGIQFDALFTDGLYFEIGRHAIDMAERLKEAALALGVPFLLDSPTNQQFFVLTDDQLARLRERVAVTLWEKPDETHSAIRVATTWSTTEEDLREAIDALREIMQQ